MKSPAALIGVLLVLAGCAEFTGERSSNSILSANADPVLLFSEEQEVALGRQSATAAMGQYKASKDAALGAYVDKVGQGLAKRGDRPNLAYSFTVIESAELNAFATPGGFIFITTGLLKGLKDEAALAAVLGHEIGHVVKQHSLKRMQRQFVLENGLGVLSAVLGGKTGALLQQFGPIAGNLALLRNGREAELEADEQGLQISARAGLDPAAMLDVQELLRSQGAGSRGPVEDMFATHPPSEDRLKQARSLLPRYAGAEDRGAGRYQAGALSRL